MDKLSKINVFRRTLMQSLTKNVGKSTLSVNKVAEGNFHRILICRPNARLGNLLLLTPLIQEVMDEFPNCKIDLFVKGNLAPILFEKYQNINRIIHLPGKPFQQLPSYIYTWFRLKKQKYDLVINAIPTSSSGRLSAKIATSKCKIFGEVPVLEIKDVAYKHIAKHPVYAFKNYMQTAGIEVKTKPIACLDLRLCEKEKEHGLSVLNDLVTKEKKTISLFTYATGEKCHSKEWWAQMYNALQKHFSEYNILEILPKENVSQIDFKAPTYYSRNLREIAAVLHNTSVFIGADSGMMHLSSAANTPTIGLFSVTDPEKYAPYNEFSSAVNTKECSIDKCLEYVEKALRRER